jgi:hypothetical protein
MQPANQNQNQAQDAVVAQPTAKKTMSGYYLRPLRLPSTRDPPLAFTSLITLPVSLPRTQTPPSLSL